MCSDNLPPPLPFPEEDLSVGRLSWPQPLDPGKEKVTDFGMKSTDQAAIMSVFCSVQKKQCHGNFP